MLSESAYRQVLVFENGFVAAITQDASRADLFSTDRIDFRRFHREVASKEVALFTLKSLGSSEVRFVQQGQAVPSQLIRR